MKSLLLSIAIIFTFFAITSTSAQDIDPCKDKTFIGVEIITKNYDNPIEAEKLTAAVMNHDIVKPTDPYCITHSAGKSERRLVVQITSRSLGTQRGYDDQNTQIKRAIGQTGLDLLVKSLPSKYRRHVGDLSKTFAKNYLVDPRITWEAIQVEVTTTFYSNDKILWQGLGSRVFIMQRKSFPGQPGEDVRIISGGSMQELVPYAALGAIVVPQSLSNFNDRRAKQFMKLLVTMDAMLPQNIIVGGQELLSQKQQPQ